MKNKLTEIGLVIDELKDDNKWIDWLNVFDEEYHSLSELTDIKSKKEISSLMSEINALDKKYKIVLVEVDHELKSNITKEFNDKNENLGKIY